jgi:integrase/recombinase XerD
MKKIRLSKALEGFLIAKKADGVSQSTIDLYTWTGSIMCSYLNDPHIEEISKEDLRRLFNWLRQDYKPSRRNGNESPLAPASIDRFWTCMSSLYTWMDTEYSIGRPDKAISRPKYKSKEIIPFSEEDVESLLKSTHQTAASKSTRRKNFSMDRPTKNRDQAIILTLLDTGIRVSECARIKVSEVNLKSGEIHISPFGTGQKTKPRTVFLGNSTKKVLWRYLAERENVFPEDHLFLNRDNHPMTRHAILKLLNNIGTRAGVPDTHPHRFRHTFALEYLRNGGDIFTLQRILGHSSLEMVKRYLSIATSDAKKAHRSASPVDRWRL